MDFSTCYGHYEFMVISFNLTITITTFINLINRVLKPFLDQFIIVFIDDILVYSWSKEEHEQHLRINLYTLRERKLYAKFSKCKIRLSNMAFLRHVVSKNGIQVGCRKTKAMHYWPRPTFMMEIHNFQGLATFYQCFVKNFSMLIDSLTKLTQKNVKYK